MSLVGIISENKDLFTIVLATIVCLVIFIYVYWSRMPPGPIGLPYLGYYPFLSEDCCVDLYQMSKKYGKVFCFTVTGQLYANIIDMKTMREVSVTKSDYFEIKPTNFTLFQDTFGGGIFCLNGEELKVLKKFFVNKFKEFGMGKKTQEGIIQDCLKKTVNSLNKSDGNLFGALKFFSDLANDVILHLIFGNVKLDENDNQRFNESYGVVTFIASGKKILLAGPLLRYVLIPFVSEFRNCRKHKKRLDAIIGKIIKQHEKEFDKNNIRNLVDAYIHERKLLEEKKDPKAKFFTERCLVSSVIQFFGDGNVSVGWITAGILRTLSIYPGVQKAIQAEIDEVVGRNRLPSLDDKSKLSYTTAAVYEAFRTNKFLPVQPALECTKETTLAGCRIPKGAVPVYNLWAAFHDPEVYDEPNKFDPTRFLTIDGKNPRCEIPMGFGVGKRSCIGESLVTMQFLLYVATVLQHFDLHPLEENESQTEEWNIFIRATPRAS